MSREFEKEISKTFRLEKRMNVINEIRKLFTRKLKYHIFSCLKFCFKIPKI